MADALATLASMYQVDTRNDVPRIRVRRLDRPAHVFAIEETSDEKPWYYDIKHFLQTQEYPTGASNKDRKTLRRLDGSFFLNEDVLYKRNYDMVLLICVDRNQANVVRHEVREGSFGTHANGHSMAKNMLREGYYWLTMESDFTNLQRSAINARCMLIKFIYLRRFSMLFPPHGLSLCGVLT